LRASEGEEALPVLWEDNYFALMPGEEREVTAVYPKEALDESAAVVAVDGWNVAPASR